MSYLNKFLPGKTIEKAIDSIDTLSKQASNYINKTTLNNFFDKQKEIKKKKEEEITKLNLAIEGAKKKQEELTKKGSISPSDSTKLLEASDILTNLTNYENEHKELQNILENIDNLNKTPEATKTIEDLEKKINENKYKSVDNYKQLKELLNTDPVKKNKELTKLINDSLTESDRLSKINEINDQLLLKDLKKKETEGDKQLERDKEKLRILKKEEANKEANDLLEKTQNAEKQRIAAIQNARTGNTEYYIKISAKPDIIQQIKNGNTDQIANILLEPHSFDIVSVVEHKDNKDYLYLEPTVADLANPTINNRVELTKTAVPTLRGYKGGNKSKTPRYKTILRKTRRK